MECDVHIQNDLYIHHAFGICQFRMSVNYEEHMIPLPPHNQVCNLLVFQSIAPSPPFPSPLIPHPHPPFLFETKMFKSSIVLLGCIRYIWFDLMAGRIATDRPQECSSAQQRASPHPQPHPRSHARLSQIRGCCGWEGEWLAPPIRRRGGRMLWECEFEILGRKDLF